MKMTDKPVKIPEELHAWIEGRLPKTEFDSIDSYVTYVLEEVRRQVDEEEGAGSDGEGEGEEVFSEEEEEKVKERLRALGYLD